MLIFSLFSGVLCVLHMGSNDIYDRGKIHLYLNFFDMWGCFGWNCGDMMQNTQWLQYKMCFLVCFCVAVETYLWLSSNSSSVIEFKLIWTYGYFTYICSIPNRWSSCFSPTFFFSRHGGQEPHQEMAGRIPPEVYNSAASAKPLPWIRRSCRRRSWDCGTRMSPGWPTAKRWAWMSWWIKDEFGQWSISSGKQKHLLNMAIETVDFPIKSGDVP